MFIQVRLLRGYSEPLLYKIPEHWKNEYLIGSIVKVPIRNKIDFAIIEKIQTDAQGVSFKIKEAISIENFPEDKNYNEFINELSNYYQIDSLYFIKRIKQFFKENKPNKNKILQNISNNNHKNITLTEEQQNITNFLTDKITKNSYCPTLLHGVTGSGKTEIYKKLIEHTILENKSILLLLPEVTLAQQFEKIFLESLKEIKICSFHSGVNQAEKKNLWNFLIKKNPILLIGVHLPILLPISNLGLIIVDEEHDTGYQEKKHPKINSKEAAILKAKINKIPILLGSATPSINSLFNVKNKYWNFFQLKNRFQGAFPKIEIIELNDKKQRKNFWISNKLELAIKEKLEKNEQSIIFINRRGFSFFVQCKNCNFIFKCLNCSVSLTLHKDNWLYCHYCNLRMQMPKICKICKEDQFLKKGIGTEQTVSILQSLFPQAKIERADMDVSVKKKKWQQIIKDFKENKIDILVGTQTITKGYHFPNVTLVGILWGDLNLNFPIYNASEIALQQLIQVAGRAGRQNIDSNVIVQTMNYHEIFNFLNETDYLKFYKSEIEKRREIFYPPISRLVEIEFKHSNETIIDTESNEFAIELQKQNFVDLQILGPSKPIVEKVKNIFIRKIFIKSKNINDIVKIFNKIEKKHYKSKINFVPNPVN